MLVSLAPKHTQREPAPAAPLLAPEARVVLGGSADADGLASPIVPGPATLFGPRGAALAGANGPLFVCDTGHHRVLIWAVTPTADNTPADTLIGQPEFCTEGRNGGTTIGPATLNVPTGICAAGGVLAVADAWNHRVLLWHSYPTRPNQPADVVLGQPDFCSGLANRGTGTARADTLNWCYGVAIAGKKLIVADTGNRRVLIWDDIPETNGAPADMVLGQPSFGTRDENAGAAPGPAGMRWPHGIAVAGGMLMVSDAGNNRVMVWRNVPARNGAACDFVLGQAAMSDTGHNRDAYYPTARSMNMPYGLAAVDQTLVVADTANSRLTGFDLAALAMDTPAVCLSGQHDFSGKGDNRWGIAARDTLCWPYDAAAAGGTLAIADSGNNRVLLWDAA